VLAASNRPDRLDNILQNFDRQNYPHTEMILLLNSDDYVLDEVKRRVASRARVQVYQLSESRTLAECLNHGIDVCSGGWVAKFDDDDLYGENYISDMLLPSRFSDAAVFGKRAHHCYFEAKGVTALRFASQIHRQVPLVHGATMFVRRAVFDRLRFSPVKRGTDTLFQRSCREQGLHIYSADPYNFIHFRHGAGARHTWQVSDRELLDGCNPAVSGLALDEVMI
jgi:glycosyltransferase involved in cell wall biosynthesis